MCTSADDDFDDPAEAFYIVEGEQLGYLPGGRLRVSRLEINTLVVMISLGLVLAGPSLNEIAHRNPPDPNHETTL